MAKKIGDWKLNLSFNNVLTCVAYALTGVFLMVLNGKETVGLLMTFIGLIFVAFGVIDVLKNELYSKGLLESVVGIAVIVMGWLVAEIVMLVLGIVLIVKSGSEILEKWDRGIESLLPPIITAVTGVLFIIAKWALIEAMCITAGVVFIINAGFVLFGKSSKKK